MDCHSNARGILRRAAGGIAPGIQKRVHTKPDLSRGPGRVLAVFLLSLFVSPAAFCRQTTTQQTTTDPIERGRVIFSRRCAECHGDHGQGVSAIVSIAGPSLLAEHDPGQVMTAVEVGPEHMPSFAWTMSVEDMRDVSQFVAQRIAVIPLTGGNLSEGGVLFRTYCSTCHRTAVRGGALAFDGVNAPNLAHQSKAIVAGAIRWGPGPMPAFPASVLTDQQVASITDYVSYVQHPPSPGGSPLKWIGPVAEGCVAWIVVFGIVAATMWIERGGRG